MSWHISKALMDAYENSRSLPALVEEYSQGISSDGAPSVPSSTNHTPLLYSSSDRMMEFCRRSPSGMTCEHLTESLGEDVLMWFLGVFLAPTSAPQGVAPESQAKRQGSGKKWHGSFAKFDPATFSWKIPHCLPLVGSMSFSATWPRWGSVVPGVCLEPLTSERRTRGIESGSEENQSYEQDAGIYQAVAGIILSAMWDADGKKAFLKWSAGGLGTIYEAEILFEEMPGRIAHKEHGYRWPIQVPGKDAAGGLLRTLRIIEEFTGTPQGQKFIQQHSGEFADSLRELSQHVALAGAEGEWITKLEWRASAQPMPERRIKGTESGLWATPQAHDCHNGNPERVGRFGTKHGGRSLNDEIFLWPTPTVHGDYNRKGLSKNSGDGLATAVKLYPAPTSTNTKAVHMRGADKGRKREARSYFPTPTAVTASGGAALCKWGGAGSREKLKSIMTPAEINGALNPDWVEWLMNWPIGWTSLGQLNPEIFHEWQREFRIESGGSNVSETDRFRRAL